MPDCYRRFDSVYTKCVYNNITLICKAMNSFVKFAVTKGKDCKYGYCVSVSVTKMHTYLCKEFGFTKQSNSKTVAELLSSTGVQLIKRGSSISVYRDVGGEKQVVAYQPALYGLDTLYLDKTLICIDQKFLFDDLVDNVRGYRIDKYGDILEVSDEVLEYVKALFSEEILRVCATSDEPIDVDTFYKRVCVRYEGRKISDSLKKALFENSLYNMVETCEIIPYEKPEAYSSYEVYEDLVSKNRVICEA